MYNVVHSVYLAIQAFIASTVQCIHVIVLNTETLLCIISLVHISITIYLYDILQV